MCAYAQKQILLELILLEKPKINHNSFIFFCFKFIWTDISRRQTRKEKHTSILFVVFFYFF